DSVPEQPGKTAVEMFDALRDGTIKAVWIACTNPAQSMPDLGGVIDALNKAELVVVQDAFHDTETTAFADVLLPATTWGEKEGTVTNSERRVTHLMPAIAAPGEACHDWQIATDFAHRLGRLLGSKRNAVKLFPYTQPEQIFNEHRETTRGRDLDITGLSYKLLDASGPQQWPFVAGQTEGKARLYADGVFQKPGGKAHCSNTIYKATFDKTDARHPLHLTTGRLRDQWHGMSRTGIVAQLFNHAEEPVISMNGGDMKRRSIEPGDLVKVSNKRGSLMLRAQSSNEMMPAQTFIPMHWGSQHMNGLGVNALMPKAFDKVSKQPELKHAAVKIEKPELPWRMTVMRTCKDLHLLQQIRGLLKHFDYASCGLYGRGDGIVILRAAHSAAPDAAIIQQLDEMLGMTEETPMLNYNDAKRGISKRILVEGDQVTGVRLIGENLAAEWLKEVMTSGSLTEELRRWALAPISAPPTGQRSRGKIICSCLDVSESEIIDLISMGGNLPALQAKLKCGTECGSCMPELKRLVQAHSKTAV
ncbi:MAG TPA: molybdopterin-dependent oxidoreductase, partial [Methylophilaceae bacterium]|nr:molybdopterin-dependent oxidoreductase [Methylophilaceae bacterium]